MKNLILLFGLLLPAGLLPAQEMLHGAPSLGSSNAEIKFEKDVHNFGQVKQGDEAAYEFTFTNTGTEPLIISNAEGSCDCTVPSYPKHPIRPGEKATIKVVYDTKKSGSFIKTVKITSNARNARVKELTINGTVVSAAQKSVK